MFAVPLFQKLAQLSIFLLSRLLELFPEADTNYVVDVASQWMLVREQLGKANWFLPIDTLLFYLSVVMIIEGTIIGFHVYHWIAKNISAGTIR